MLFHRIPDGKTDIQLLFRTFHKILTHHSNDLLHLLLAQWMEDQNLINPVQKLRTENQLHFVHDITFHPLIVSSRIFPGIESQFLRIDDGLGTCIRGHDDDRIAKIHLTPLGICNMSVIQYLQENIEHIRMRFFNLVEQDHGVRMPAYLFAELPAFVMSHISRR